MNDDSVTHSWLGVVGLLVILGIISIIAFILSSLEGVAAGIIVVFIGLVIGFFRDDLKQALGLSQKKEVSSTREYENENPLYKVEKKIAKTRKSLVKCRVKYEASDKPKDRHKAAQYMYQKSSDLISLIDQAKALAIQEQNLELLEHYKQMKAETEEIQNKAAAELAL